MKNRNFIINKQIIFVIFIFNVSIFLILFILKIGVDFNDNNLPIEGTLRNNLPTIETIKFKMNDSIYKITLDSNESKDLKLTYRNGLNKIEIFLSNSQAIVDTTLSINTRYPGELYIELDSSTDDLGHIWKVDTSDIQHEYYYYKSLIKVQNGKRLKFAIFGNCIE